MKVKQIFLNPFAEFMEWQLFFVGVFGFLLSSYFIYLSGQQFNGFMHFYQPEMTVSLWAGIARSCLYGFGAFCASLRYRDVIKQKDQDH